jgi:hypothetical protein
MRRHFYPFQLASIGSVYTEIAFERGCLFCIRYSWCFVGSNGIACVVGLYDIFGILVDDAGYRFVMFIIAFLLVLVYTLCCLLIGMELSTGVE